MHCFVSCIQKGGNPAFDLVVALDYYDGPERGVALYSSGSALRFSALGESRSRCFRAFEFAAIDGLWWDKAVRAVEADGAHRIEVPAVASVALKNFEQAVVEAVSTSAYLAIGTPSLDWLMVCPTSDEQLRSIRKTADSPAIFHEVHQLIKQRR